jgi:hypothetical protein
LWLFEDVHLTNEYRGSQRQRTFKGGSISFASAPSVDCIIRNLSETGARIELERPVDVPDKFTLLIKPEILKRSCEVAWRSGVLIGVRFA